MPTWQSFRARVDIRDGEREILVVPKPLTSGAGVVKDQGVIKGTGNSSAGVVCEANRCTGELNGGTVLESV